MIWSGKRIGSIERIFGPVESPYIAIKPDIGGSEMAGLVGREIFVK